MVFVNIGGAWLHFDFSRFEPRASAVSIFLSIFFLFSHFSTSNFPSQEKKEKSVFLRFKCPRNKSHSLLDFYYFKSSNDTIRTKPEKEKFEKKRNNSENLKSEENSGKFAKKNPGHREKLFQVSRGAFFSHVEQGMRIVLKWDDIL